MSTASPNLPENLPQAVVSVEVPDAISPAHPQQPSPNSANLQQIPSDTNKTESPDTPTGTEDRRAALRARIEARAKQRGIGIGRQSH